MRNVEQGRAEHQHSASRPSHVFIKQRSRALHRPRGSGMDARPASPTTPSKQKTLPARERGVDTPQNTLLPTHRASLPVLTPSSKKQHSPKQPLLMSATPWAALQHTTSVAASSRVQPPGLLRPPV